MEKKILDLGCGSQKLTRKKCFPNYDFRGKVIGLDINKNEETDIICDLNKGKIPFKNNEFDIVYTSHCLEHLDNITKILSEIHRILKPGGYFLVRVPHISYINSLGDLSHKRLFGYSSFDYLFLKYHEQLKNEPLFKLIKRRTIFGKFYKNIGIEFLANKFPTLYNNFFTGIFQAREMHWELRKLIE
tara:strand:- start:670 stop:1230 length:561 start_codon:yes stop_codon:yes gene_type:complete